jgi:hypothetical protein
MTVFEFDQLLFAVFVDKLKAAGIVRRRNVTDVALLLSEIERFRSWADSCSLTPHEQRLGEWECGYGHWDDIYDAVLGFVAARPFDSWSADEVQAVLYAVARDNEMEHLVEELRCRHPELLVVLARRSIDNGEMNARWQLADQMGYLKHVDADVEAVLVALAHDREEYVRRRALAALARLGSLATEALALEAWSRQDDQQEYTRMQILWSLHKVGSRHLEPLLAEAERDERGYLRAFARKVRRGEITP